MKGGHLSNKDDTNLSEKRGIGSLSANEPGKSGRNFLAIKSFNSLVVGLDD